MEKVLTGLAWVVFLVSFYFIVREQGENVGKHFYFHKLNWKLALITALAYGYLLYTSMK